MGSVANKPDLNPHSVSFQLGTWASYFLDPEPQFYFL